VSDSWVVGGEPPTGGDAPGTTTLIDGTTFCISSITGDIDPALTEGLFVRDTRFLSRWRMLVDGSPTQPVSVVTEEPFRAAFVSRPRPSVRRPDPGLLVARRRIVGDGMTEELELRNLSAEALTVEVTFEVDADFAHLFEVKADQVRPRGFHSVEVAKNEMLYAFREDGRSRRLRLSMPPEVDAGPGEIRLTVVLAPRERWQRRFEFRVEVDGRMVALAHGEFAAGERRPAGWRRLEVPLLYVADERLAGAWNAAADDLAALRIYDPDHPEEVVVAAGAPWFMALFGRDSLLTSWMILHVEPAVATGTLQALARRQGSRVDTSSEEQPGRILHEVRFRLEGPGAGVASAYYGSIDSTPLFVVLLDEARRFGAPPELVAALLPNADRALAWVDEFGDRDGDGFVEYARPFTHRGLVNQGWKDSPDSVSFADGRIAEAPVALCEVQGYVYAAFTARARLAAAAGDDALAKHWEGRAEALKAQFNEAFFLADRGYFALALDGHKRPVDGLASNMGHLLWSGIVTDAAAPAVAEHLRSAELFSGWGVRTLATSMRRYHPMSYHNGSVWPHDNALIAAGLMRYGFTDDARRIAAGLFEASEAFGGHLPELFCGFDRADFAAPIAYPAACTPQAWASATALSLLRTLLDLEPDLPAGRVAFAPAPLDSWAGLRLEGLALGDARARLELLNGEAVLSGLPEGLSLTGARRASHPSQG